MANDVAKLSDLEGVFGNIVGVALGLAGIALFIMLLVGGFRYITAGGDPKGVEGARKTLTYAVSGIVLIALSFLILRFIEQFTGAPVTEFKIFQGQ
jgi:hypothetical protein